MDGNITKALWIGVGVLFFVAVVSVGMLMLNKGREVGTAGAEKIDTLSQELESLEYDNYDGTTVSGSDVRSVLRKYKSHTGEFMVVIQTNSNKPNTFVQYISSGTLDVNDFTVSNLDDKTDTAINNEFNNVQSETTSGGSLNPSYVNPNGQFDSTLFYDENGLVRAIRFIQR